MPDILLEGRLPGTKERYRDMGDGTNALVVYTEPPILRPDTQLAVIAANGAIASLGAIADAPYVGSGPATAISALKGIYAELAGGISVSFPTSMASTQSGAWNVNLTIENASFTKLTDGTNTAAVKEASTAPVAADPALVVALSPNSGARVTDGTNTAAVKAASTAPVAADPALVVALSPNGTANVQAVNMTTWTFDIASGAITTTTTSAAVNQLGYAAASFALNCTAASGTNPTLDVAIQETLDNGLSWHTIYHFARLTAAGAEITPPLLLSGTQIRFVRTVGGTTPSFTMSMARRVAQAVDGVILRRFFDRALATSQALNATTATYLIDGCKSLTMLASSAAATTPCTLQAQVSEDGVKWLNVGSPVATVANSVVQLCNVVINAKFARAIVTVAGAGQTLDYVTIRAA